MPKKLVVVAEILLLLALAAACNKSSMGSITSNTQNVRFITSEKAVFKNCRASLNERFVACEKHIYNKILSDDLTPISHAAENFSVVVVDTKNGKVYDIKNSNGGSEPSVSNNGEVLFRKFGKLIFTNTTASSAQKEINIKGQFKSVMRPSVSPDGKKVVLIGRYIGEDESLPASLNAFVVNLSSRKITSVPKFCKTSSNIVDVGWTDNSHIYLSFRERGQSGLVWNRTLKYGISNNTCSLIYFGDAATLRKNSKVKSETWRFEPRVNLFEALVKYESDNYNGTGLLIRSTSGEEMARFPLAISSNDLCLDDLGVLLSGNKIIVSCYNSQSGGFDLAEINWREWGKQWQKSKKAAKR